MNVTEIKEIAQQYNIKTGRATKSELVRAIQQCEGNQQCFDSNISDGCGQHACAWREDCD